jgi:hypothetical protein
MATMAATQQSTPPGVSVVDVGCLQFFHYVSSAPEALRKCGINERC